MRRTAILACSLALATAGLASDSAAYTLRRSRSGRVVHWETRRVRIAVDPRFPSRTVPADGVLRALDEAAKAWSSLAEVRVEVAREQAGEEPDLPAAVVLRFRSAGWKLAATQLGRTTLQVDDKSGEARSASIEVNEQDHAFTEATLGIVLAHELGHVLGLDHSADPQALMFETNELNEDGNRTPNDDDRAGLAEIYGGARTRSVVLFLREAPARRSLTPCTRRRANGDYTVGPCEDAGLPAKPRQRPQP